MEFVDSSSKYLEVWVHWSPAWVSNLSTLVQECQGPSCTSESETSGFITSFLPLHLEGDMTCMGSLQQGRCACVCVCYIILGWYLFALSNNYDHYSFQQVKQYGYHVKATAWVCVVVANDVCIQIFKPLTLFNYRLILLSTCLPSKMLFLGHSFSFESI